VHTEGGADRGERFVADTGDPHYEGTVNDATFIAASRTDVPALTAAIRAVQKVCVEAQEDATAYLRSVGTFEARMLSANVQVDRILAALSAHVDLEES
jgi:hypothetical protein